MPEIKLIDLEPEWVHPNILVFKCPHCKEVYLSIKDVVMDIDTQIELFSAKFPLHPLIVPDNSTMAWNISNRDLEHFTATPSLDASKAGHWHGFITNGICV